MNERKKVIVRAMGKDITIDNPDNIRIVFKGRRPSEFNLKINMEGLERLRRALGRLRPGI